MASKIAPLRPVKQVAVDYPPICDRCAAVIVASEPLAVTDIRLRGARILVDKLAPVGADAVERVGTAGLFAPVQAARKRQVYGIEAFVLAVGPAIDPADIKVGDRVILDEFAGRPLWWNGRTLPYWIVGEGEVMLVVDRDVKVGPIDASATYFDDDGDEPAK